MSTATPNFFAVLGDESGPAVGTGAVHLHDAPKVAESRSSKKADVNPKADPSKARKKAPGAPSNDRVLKENKDAGRSGNRRVPVQEGANSHHSRRSERTDRVPRSNKRDTPKRTRAGWGDENAEPEEQAAGVAIAHDQEAADASEDAEPIVTEPEAPHLTLEEYQQQQREIAEGLRTRSKKPAAPAAPAAPAPSSEESTVPEPRKKLSNKPRKEVRTIEVDFKLPPVGGEKRSSDDRKPRGGDGASRAPRSSSGPRGGSRSGSARGSSGKPNEKSGKPAGGKPAGKTSGGKSNGKPAGGKPATAGKSKKGPSFDLNSLPQLN